MSDSMDLESQDSTNDQKTNETPSIDTESNNNKSRAKKKGTRRISKDLATRIKEGDLTVSALELRDAQGTTSSIMRRFSNKASQKPSIKDRMKKDPRFRKTTDEKKKEIEEYFDRLLTIKDENGQSERRADLNNPDDMQKLAETVNVFVKGEKEPQKQLSDIQTGVLGLGPNNFPKDIAMGMNKSKILPIFGVIQKEEFNLQLNSVDDILVLVPLISLPVYTPKLVMLATGERFFSVADSFSILRYYIVLIKVLGKVDFTKSRKLAAITWLQVRLNNRKLTKKELKDFADNTIILEDKVNLASPHDLIKSFEEGTLDFTKIENLKKYIKEVKKYKNEWDKGQTYREDIVEEHREFKIELVEELNKKIDAENLNPVKDYDRIVKALYEMTFKFLNCYEIQIMRLYEEACIKPCKLKDFRADLVTKPACPNLEEINEETIQGIKKSRELFTRLRNQFLSKIEVEEGTKIHPAYPTNLEIHGYLKFLEYNAKTSEDFRNDVAALKSVIETKNRAERIESKKN